ncbi:MAG: hypothetical protein RSA79_00950 [Oscillospiraceae bacterium]
MKKTKIAKITLSLTICSIIFLINVLPCLSNVYADDTIPYQPTIASLQPAEREKGKALLADFDEKMKPIRANKEWIEIYSDLSSNDEDEELSFISQVIEDLKKYPSSMTKERALKMTISDRERYNRLVLSKPTDACFLLDGYGDKYTFKNPGIIGKENVGKIGDEAYKAQSKLLKWLKKMHEEQGIFINVYDYELPQYNEETPPTISDVSSNSQNNANANANATVSSPSSQTSSDTKGPVKEPVKDVKENVFVTVLKKNWITLSLIVIALTAFLIIRHKRKSKNISN